MKDDKTIAKIKVVGVGGAGGNTLNDMIGSDVKNIDFIAANTDIQDLFKSKAKTKLQLGEKITKGLGAGANPEVGQLSAEEDKDKIKSALADTDLLFITAGMGGGTGTGAAPVIAKIAKDLGILTAAIVTKPFSFEGVKRNKNAGSGIEKLASFVDTLVVIPNDRLFDLPDKEISLSNAFEEANKILKIGMKSIADLITTQGYINLDFADVKTVMSGSGLAMLGFGYAEGDDRAVKATDQALSSPLLERPISGAKRVLLNITGGENVGLKEANEIATMIAEATGDSAAEIIFGTVVDDKMNEGIKVTVIATDFSDKPKTKSIEVPNFNDSVAQVMPLNRSGYHNEPPQFDNVSMGGNTEDYDDELDVPAVLRRTTK